MLTITQIAGFAGTGLAGAAYVPQISHLVRARCSAGISRLAFEVWLLASVLTTVRAIAIHAGVFIVLGGIQIVATALIMLCAIRYKDTPCPVHLPRQPAATTATGTGTSGNEPGFRRRPVAASTPPAGHGRVLRAYIPVLSRIPLRSPPGLAGNRMSRPSAADHGHKLPLRRLTPTLSGRTAAGRAPDFKRRT
jgi:hypothetical protein